MGEKEELPGGVRGGAARRWLHALVRPPAGAELSTARVASYGVGGFTFVILGDIPGFFLNPFLLEVAYMEPVAAGNMLLVAKVFDAVIDPLIGTMSDETRSSMGRRRPWMLAAMPLAVLFNILLWHAWPQLASSDAGKFAYYLICYCLVTLSLTMYYIPYTALLVTVSSKDIDRVRLSTARAVNMVVGDLVCVGIVTLTMGLFPNDAGLGYQVATYINTGLLLMVFLVSLFGVPEPSSKHMAKHSLRTELARFFGGMWALLRSWTFMSLSFLTTFGYLAMYFVQNNLFLYTKYAVNLPDMFETVLLIALASCVVFVPFWYWLLTVMSKRKVMAAGSLWLLTTMVVLIFMPEENVPLSIVVALLSGGGISLMNLLPMIMLADVIDDDELRHGLRREGLMSAFFVFLNKVTSGLSLGITGYVLAAAGYDNSGGTEPEPSPELNRAMRLLCGVIPAVLTVLMFPLLYYHPITHTRQLEINRRIVEQRHQPGGTDQDGAAGGQLEDQEAAPLLASKGASDVHHDVGSGSTTNVAFDSSLSLTEAEL